MLKRKTSRSRDGVLVKKRGKSSNAPESNANASTAAADPEARLRHLRNCLHVSTLPDKLVCRRHERDTILSFVQHAVTQRRGDSLYIAGSPGTGKTLCLHHALKTINNSNLKFKLRVVQLNAMFVSPPSSIYTQLLQQIEPKSGKLSPAKAAERLQNIFVGKQSRPNDKMTLLVVDEIDGLLSRAQTVLYSLFSWPKNQRSSLILIGIANAMDLTNRFLPRLQSRGCSPHFLVFPAYTQSQLYSILKQRILIAHKAHSHGQDNEAEEEQEEEEQETDDKREEDESLPWFDPAAVELCTRKVAAQTGDIRRCLDLCRQSLNTIPTAIQLADQDDQDSPAAEQEEEVVSISSMSSLLRSALGSPYADALKELPRQAQNVMCIMAIVCNNLKDTLGESWFRSIYPDISKQFGLPPVSNTELVDILGYLKASGLVSEGKMFGRGSKAGVKLSVSIKFSDLVFVLESLNPLFKAMFAKGPTIRLAKFS